MPNTFDPDGAPEQRITHQLVSGLHGPIDSGSRADMKALAQKMGVTATSKPNTGGYFIKKIPIIGAK